jgi:hypothetical protein
MEFVGTSFIIVCPRYDTMNTVVCYLSIVLATVYSTPRHRGDLWFVNDAQHSLGAVQVMRGRLHLRAKDLTRSCCMNHQLK